MQIWIHRAVCVIWFVGFWDGTSNATWWRLWLLPLTSLIDIVSTNFSLKRQDFESCIPLLLLLSKDQYRYLFSLHTPLCWFWGKTAVLISGCNPCNGWTPMTSSETATWLADAALTSNWRTGGFSRANEEASWGCLRRHHKSLSMGIWGLSPSDLDHWRNPILPEPYLNFEWSWRIPALTG